MHLLLPPLLVVVLVLLQLSSPTLCDVRLQSWHDTGASRPRSVRATTTSSPDQLIAQALVSRNETRTIRVGYMATRSFFGKFVSGGFMAELIFRAANEFWQMHEDNVDIEVGVGVPLRLPNPPLSLSLDLSPSLSLNLSQPLSLSPPLNLCAYLDAAILPNAKVCISSIRQGNLLPITDNVPIAGPFTRKNSTTTSVLRLQCWPLGHHSTRHRRALSSHMHPCAFCTHTHAV